VPHSVLPYALIAPVFPFRHLAALAGRAPIGGAREVALACFVVARLVADRLVEGEQPAEPARAARATSAKSWLGTLALPSAVRGPLTRCIQSSVEVATTVLGREVSALSAAAASYLDAGSRAELDALAAALSAQAATP
jgi:hypothetical protein